MPCILLTKTLFKVVTRFLFASAKQTLFGVLLNKSYQKTNSDVSLKVLLEFSQTNPIKKHKFIYIFIYQKVFKNTSVQQQSTQYLVTSTPNFAMMFASFCLLLWISSGKQWKKVHLRIKKHSNLPFAKHFKRKDDAVHAFHAGSSHFRIIDRDNKPWNTIQPHVNEKMLQEDANQRVQFDDNFEDVHKRCRDKKQGSYDSFSLNFNFDGLEVKILPKKNNESEASAEVVLDSNDSNELITEVLRLAYSEGLEEKVADIYYKLGAASNENYEMYLKREFEYLLSIERDRVGVSIEDFKLWSEGGGWSYGENYIHDSWKVCLYVYIYL